MPSKSLPVRTRWQLETMVGDHIREITRASSSLRLLLFPVLSIITNGADSAPEDETTSQWPEAGHVLFHHVSSLRELVRGLLEVPGAEPNSSTARRTLGLLRALDEELSNPDSVTSVAFLKTHITWAV